MGAIYARLRRGQNHGAVADHRFFAGDGRVYADYGGGDPMAGHAPHGAFDAGGVFNRLAGMRLCADFRRTGGRADGAGGVGGVFRAAVV